MEEYLSKILKQINTTKGWGGKSIYLMNVTLLKSTVRSIEAYFKLMPEYTIETRKCARCKNQWDIIITWR